MTDQDIKNNEIINNLVRNHFALSSESKDLFSKIISNKKKKMEFIPDDFRDMLGEDLRVRYPIGSGIEEAIDKGWGAFKECFYEFLKFNKVSYSNFKENKIKIQKNEVKLFKYVKKWYIENEDSDKYNTRSFIYGYNNVQSALERKIERIGAMKLPKKDLEVVVSFNFADWFMCSTAENWTSCLNLESSYENAYWSGLPGLIVDKNRMMIYITSGEKKNYKGIEVDKMISRTWALLDENDIVTPLRHYPQSFFSKSGFSELFPFKVSPDPLDSCFRSKYDFSEMITNYAHKVVFIYQDETKFDLDDGIVSIVSGNSGMHTVTDYNDKRFSCLDSSEDDYCYCEGLSGLIDSNLSLEDCEGGRYCYECGERLSEGDLMLGSDEEYYCECCHNENFIYCYECNTVVARVNTFEHDGDSYCESCYDEKFTICEDCGDILEYYKSYSTEAGNLCESCYDEKFTICEECGTEIQRDDSRETETGNLCESCYDEKFTICEECDKEIQRDDSHETETGLTVCEDCFNKKEKEEVA